MDYNCGIVRIYMTAMKDSRFSIMIIIRVLLISLNCFASRMADHEYHTSCHHSVCYHFADPSDYQSDLL